jgi:tetratricopeptide (TPR) repeat protein
MNVMIPLLALALQAQDSTLARGVQLYDEGKVDDAARLFKQAVSTNPGSVEARIWLGRAYLQQLTRVSFIKKPIVASNAKGEFDKAVALDPQNIAAREARANYYMNAPSIAGGGMDKARAEAAAAEQFDPYRGALLTGRVLERSKDVAAAEAKYRSLLTAFPDSSAPAAAIASLFQSQKRWAEAFALIDAWLLKWPNDPVMAYQLGRTAALSGERLNEGEDALKTFLARPGKGRPVNNAPGHYRLGMILERRGDLVGAIEQYERAHRLDPYYEEAEAAFQRLTRKR